MVVCDYPSILEIGIKLDPTVLEESPIPFPPSPVLNISGYCASVGFAIPVFLSSNCALLNWRIITKDKQSLIQNEL